MFLLPALYAESLAVTDISEIRPLPRPSFLTFLDHFSHTKKTAPSDARSGCVFRQLTCQGNYLQTGRTDSP